MRGGFSSGTTPYGVMCSDLIAGTPKAKSRYQKTGTNTLMTDEQVLECRRLSEQEGWAIQRLLEKYAHLGVDRAYLSRLLSYEVRSKLIPKSPK